MLRCDSGFSQRIAIKSTSRSPRPDIDGAYAGENEILRWHSRLDGAEATSGALRCTWRSREASPPSTLCRPAVLRGDQLKLSSAASAHHLGALGSHDTRGLPLRSESAKDRNSHR